MKPWFTAAIEWAGGHSLHLLLGMLIPIGGAWAFLMLADEVMEGGTQRLDERILLALRQPGNVARPIGPAKLEESARDITALGGVTVIVLVTLAVAGFLLLDRKYADTLFVLAATGTGFAVGAVLKSIYRRPRPTIVPHLMQADYSSFPSGHSMMSAVVYLTLGALLTQVVAGRRLKAYVLAVAATVVGLVGLTRIYLGVHYPTDVLGGWCVGLVWSSLCWIIGRRLQRLGTIEPEG